MRTAFDIFKRDLKRIFVNPVAIIIAIGVCIIPSLYAWFNILANWDPYENTSTVPIAVVIEDEGAEVGDKGYINAGDMVEERLKDNDSEDEAIEGVKSGRYYAAFVLPKDFTSSMADVLDGDTEQAHIAYYVNEKVNAISPKVTDTGATTLEAQIANQFVQVVGETVSEKLSGLSGRLLGGIDEATASANESLVEVQSLLNGIADGLDNAGGTISDARGAVSSARSTLSQVSTSSASLASTLSSSMDSLSTTRANAGALGAQLSGALGTSVSTISGISSKANYDIGQITGDVGWAQGQLDGAISHIGALNSNTIADLTTSIQRAWDTINGLDDSTPNKQEILNALSSAESALNELKNLNDGQLATLKEKSAAIKNANDAIAGLSGSVNAAVQATSQGLAEVQGTLNTTTLPAVSSALDGFADAGGRLVGTADALAPMLSQADGTLSQLDGILAQSSGAIVQTSAGVRSAADAVGALATDTAAIQSAEAFSMLKNALDLDAEQVGDFIGSPVDMVSQPVYAVENYGSGVAPFFTNLALWVGGFVLVAIYKLEVDDEGIGKFKPWQGFFGRWLLLNLLGQVQAIICCVGDVLLGIQCLNPVAFVFAGMVESFVYVAFIYSISVAFKHIGKAIAGLLQEHLPVPAVHVWRQRHARGHCRLLRQLLRHESDRSSRVPDSGAAHWCHRASPPAQHQRPVRSQAWRYGAHDHRAHEHGGCDLPPLDAHQDHHELRRVQGRLHRARRKVRAHVSHAHQAWLRGAHLGAARPARAHVRAAREVRDADALDSLVDRHQHVPHRGGVLPRARLQEALSL